VPTAIVPIIVVLVAAGAASILVLSTRLRREIAELFRSFERAQREITPLVATVQADRDRLAAGLDRLTDPGPPTARR
jgi:hypothetical protein